MKRAVLFLTILYAQWICAASIYAQCWTEVSSGFDHSMAIHTNGSLWAWGSGNLGQLGDGGNLNRFKPVVIAVPGKWKRIRCGNAFTLGVKEDGSLWSWGDNSNGVLGNGNRVSSNIPIQIGRGFDWEEIAAGNDHCLALKKDGSLWAWGRNDHGQLGDQTTDDVLQPKQIGVSKNWNALAAGKYYSMALGDDGTLWTWGRNSSGQLGDGSYKDKTAPVKIGTYTDWIQIACSPFDEHSAALRSNHSLWLWGNNAQGQLGDGTIKSRNVPEQLSTGMAKAIWVDVHLGYHNSFAIHDNGSEHFLFAWGDNSSGMFGDGTKTDRLTPELSALNKNIPHIAPGYSHVVAQLADSSLWSWGSNASGRLGLGLQDAERLSPGKISCPNVIGVEDLEPSGFVTLYPNPVAGQFQIVCSNNALFRSFMISIYNSTGGLMFQIKARPQTDIPILESLLPGPYWMHVKDESGKVVLLPFIKS